MLYPEKQLAKWAAIRYGSEHVLDYIELDHDHAILEVAVPSLSLIHIFGEDRALTVSSLHEKFAVSLWKRRTLNEYCFSVCLTV